MIWSDHAALQNDIDCIHRWENLNKMICLPQKCKELRVAIYIATGFVLYISCEIPSLEYTDSEKDLGVITNSASTTGKQCDDNYLVQLPVYNQSYNDNDRCRFQFITSLTTIM